MRDSQVAGSPVRSTTSVSMSTRRSSISAHPTRRDSSFSSSAMFMPSSPPPDLDGSLARGRSWSAISAGTYLYHRGGTASAGTMESPSDPDINACVSDTLIEWGTYHLLWFLLPVGYDSIEISRDGCSLTIRNRRIYLPFSCRTRLASFFPPFVSSSSPDVYVNAESAGLGAAVRTSAGSGRPLLDGQGAAAPEYMHPSRWLYSRDCMYSLTEIAGADVVPHPVGGVRVILAGAFAGVLTLALTQIIYGAGQPVSPDEFTFIWGIFTIVIVLLLRQACVFIVTQRGTTRWAAVAAPRSGRQVINALRNLRQGTSLAGIPDVPHPNRFLKIIAALMWTILIALTIAALATLRGGRYLGPLADRRAPR